MEFDFYWGSNHYSALEIGDGLDPGNRSRLTHFRGLFLPDDVTSVSNSAWIIIYDAGLVGYTYVVVAVTIIGNVKVSKSYLQASSKHLEIWHE